MNVEKLATNSNTRVMLAISIPVILIVIQVIVIVILHPLKFTSEYSTSTIHK